MAAPISTDFVLALMPTLREAIGEAAALALPFFREGAHTSARVWSKAGGSPVTEADVAVDTFLKIRLSQIVPDAAWLSEETHDDPVRLDRDLVWIVDPIDGTRAFLSGHRDWSIAVALLQAGEPVAGFVHAPAGGHAYEAVRGHGASRNGQPIQVSTNRNLATARVTGPKPMADRLGRGLGREGMEPAFVRIDRVPSLALRVARVADGSIDVGLVSSDARDWDLAAADLILREAGGSVCGLDGVPTIYNRPDPVHGELVAVPHGLRDAVVSAWAEGPEPSGAGGFAERQGGRCHPETLGEMPTQFPWGMVVVGPIDEMAEVGRRRVRCLALPDASHLEGRRVGDGGPDAAAPGVLEQHVLLLISEGSRFFPQDAGAASF